MSQRARDLGLFMLVVAAIAGLIGMDNAPQDRLFTAATLVGMTGLLLVLLAIAHEFGHAILGRWAGLEVVTILLGAGRIIARGKFLGLPWELGRNPGSGMTMVMPRGPEGLRRRLAIMILGGPLVHILALAVVLPFAWSSLPPTLAFFSGGSVYGGGGITQIMLHSFLLANAIILVASLLPHSVRSGGRRTPSDGLQLLNLRKIKDVDVKDLLVQRWILEAWLALRRGQARQAEAFCRNALQITPGHVSARLNLAWALLNQRDMKRSRELVTAILAQPGLPSELRAMGLWLLIWNDVLLGTPALCWEASASAQELAGQDPNNIDFIAARGAALICVDRTDEGLDLLYRAMRSSDILEYDVDLLSLAALGELHRGKIYDARLRIGQAERRLKLSVLLDRARAALARQEKQGER